MISAQPAGGVSTPPTVGLEEEHFVVDPTTRQPVPRGPQVVDAAAAQLGEGICCEFSRSQIELRTRPCVDASGLRDELLQKRSAAAAAAIAEGVRLCASGTPVIGSDHPIAVADHPRYRAGLDQYRAMLDDFDVCAPHIHVHLPDPERVVLVGNHIRPWLPLLVALSANSPYHQGRATGYAAGVR